MSIYNLPQDIFPEKVDIPENLSFHKFAATRGIRLGKSILHKNSISLVISGKKTIIFADRTINLEDDEFHFLSAGSSLVSMSATEGNVYHAILIFFDNSVLNDFYSKYDSLITKIKSKHTIVSDPYLAFKKDGFVSNFITSLDLLFGADATISSEMRLLKFEELMLHLLENYPQKILSFAAARSRDLDDLEIKKAVEANIGNNIGVEQLAFLCHLSLSTFKRRFIKIYGMPPSRWLLLKRMEMAKHLLQHYNEKPSEVFYKVGYENHASFSQSFKHAFGVTPREFQLQRLQGLSAGR